MVNHNLIAEYNGKIVTLMHRYGESTIKEDEILKYISATLHKYLPYDDAEYIMKEHNVVRRKFKLVRDENNPNGLYQIFKVSAGYIVDSEQLIARFWVESFDRDIPPKEFLTQ